VKCFISFIILFFSYILVSYDIALLCWKCC